MKRRDFVIAGSATVLWSQLARAQNQARPPRLGMLRYGTQQDDHALKPFLGAMEALGYTQGKTIQYDYRYAENDASKLQGLARELAASRPDMMMAFGGDIAPYVRDASRSVPIVFSVSADPVRLGLVASLNRPERNATGVTFLHDELGSKRLQLLREAAPQISRVAFLWNPNHLDNELAETSRAAQALKVELLSLPVGKADELEPALEQAAAAQVDSVYVVTSTLMVNSMPRIVSYAMAKRLPLIGGWGAWASAGGLISYGPDVSVMVARTAVFVDRILRGARPADLPVERPTRFELTVNMKAARSLGLNISERYLVGADHILE
ncbi:ABC transporter substrate-binding protein [Bradyrhizobium sp.]|uniref:ABC transporter substrate-binding protein n=1 Tax=Bradyrhizobium sp. TaxID=376 RepID=UPI0040378247